MKDPRMKTSGYPWDRLDFVRPKWLDEDPTFLKNPRNKVAILNEKGNSIVISGIIKNAK